jgi:hypothetical protein
MGDFIHFVKSFGFEEKVTHLTGCHGNQPGDQGGHHRVNEQIHIGHQKRNGADQMQGLIDAAVMVKTMVIPALGFEDLQQLVHESS